MENKRPHVALLASPGLGHLVPVVELGSRLLTLHGFDVTVFAASTGSSPTQSQLLELSPPPLNVVKLAPVDISGMLLPTDSILSQLVVMMRETVPVLRSAISALTRRPDVLIVDFFGTEALEIAREFRMRTYVCVPCSAWFLALTVHVPTLDRQTKGDHPLVSARRPVNLPGCKPVQFEDAFSPILDRRSRMYGEYVQMAAALSTAEGVLVNTWRDQERKTVEALRDEKIWGELSKVPVHPIGPLVRSSGTNPSSRTAVTDWLDAQPSASVVFVSFGSGGTLSARQMTELAWGLELSRQRFVWVVRPPIENDTSAALFTVGNSDNGGCGDGTPYYLPQGFCSRTKGAGLLVPMWAAQAEILSHHAVGGFVTHCGWNSVLESVVNGVPMVAWPLYAEQPMNAALLVEELGVALRPPREEGVVGRKEVERMVRKLLKGNEGRAMRGRVRQLKRSAIEALSRGGTSHSSLSKVAVDCEKWVNSSHA